MESSLRGGTPLIVILGPTASGKTALAIELAQRFNGEIIAADSRTVYKGMDIGTAKPTPNERQKIPHHLIDVVSPSDPFTVADFKQRAEAAIADISSRGKLPFLVGGSGLYIDAVIYNFSFRPTNPPIRQKIKELSVAELQEALREKGIALPKNAYNPRHLMRTLETGGILPRRNELRPHTLLLGLNPSRETLQQSIEKRIDAMVAAGLVQEAQTLAETYGWELPALQAPAYKAFRGYLQGEMSIEDAKNFCVRYELRYAKRQKTWFNRNPNTMWLTIPATSVDIITTFLNK